MWKLISTKNAKPVEYNFDSTVKTYNNWDDALKAWQLQRAKGVATFIVPA